MSPPRPWLSFAVSSESHSVMLDPMLHDITSLKPSFSTYLRHAVFVSIPLLLWTTALCFQTLSTAILSKELSLVSPTWDAHRAIAIYVSLFVLAGVPAGLRHSDRIDLIMSDAFAQKVTSLISLESYLLFNEIQGPLFSLKSLVFRINRTLTYGLIDLLVELPLQCFNLHLLRACRAASIDGAVVITGLWTLYLPPVLFVLIYLLPMVFALLVYLPLRSFYTGCEFKTFVRYHIEETTTTLLANQPTSSLDPKRYFPISPTSSHSPVFVVDEEKAAFV